MATKTKNKGTMEFDAWERRYREHRAKCLAEARRLVAQTDNPDNEDCNVPFSEARDLLTKVLGCGLALNHIRLCRELSVSGEPRSYKPEFYAKQTGIESL